MLYWRENSRDSHKIYLYYSIGRPDLLIIKIFYFKIESICSLNIKILDYNSILELTLLAVSHFSEKNP